MKAQKQNSKTFKRDGKRLAKADRKAHLALRQSRRNAIKRQILDMNQI